MDALEPENFGLFLEDNYGATKLLKLQRTVMNVSLLDQIENAAHISSLAL